MAQDQLFQGYLLGPKAQDLRTEAADRATRDLHDPRPGLVETELGVYRPLAQPERGARLRGAVHNGLLRGGRQTRGRDVDRLFEVGALEWVGLVKQRQQLQATPRQ